jgi:hypothetical protein
MGTAFAQPGFFLAGNPFGDIIRILRIFEVILNHNFPTPFMNSVFIKRVSLAFLLLASFSGFGFSQTVIWTDNFNNGCSNDCIASTWGGWTIADNVGGVTGGAPNNWFVSCAEEGIAPPGCGSSCIGDASLHIGANPGAGGDMGASFNETGATNATFRRVQSPTISTVGYVTNTLAFDFIAFGSAGCSDDRAQLWLSTDNGATWPVGFQYCLTSVCCGACNGYSQGQWTTYTLALPAAFDNNPNVRVGYHWRNNGNGSGTDPSVAIDDVRITTVITPVDLVRFTAMEENEKVKLAWEVTEQIALSHYEVERSLAPVGFRKIGSVPASGDANTALLNYAYEDADIKASTLYYRLKMVDQNGATAYSKIVRVIQDNTQAVEVFSIKPTQREGKVEVYLWAVDDLNAQFEIVDVQGKNLASIPAKKISSGENTILLPVSALSSGVYFLTIRSTSVPEGFEPVNISTKFVMDE